MTYRDEIVYSDGSKIFSEVPADRPWLGRQYFRQCSECLGWQGFESLQSAQINYLEHVMEEHLVKKLGSIIDAISTLAIENEERKKDLK